MFAADLVRVGVSVIAATGGDASVLAAKSTTTTIPIVFTTGGDPVKLGFVSSFNRPGGNVTGVTFLGNELGSKRLELLHQLVPAATAIGVLFNPANPNSQAEMGDIGVAARVSGCISTSRTRASGVPVTTHGVHRPVPCIPLEDALVPSRPGCLDRMTVAMVAPLGRCSGASTAAIAPHARPGMR
jgi:hypothetical protein